MENGRFNGAIEVHVDVTQTAKLVREVMGLARWAMIGFVGLIAAVTALVIVKNIRDRNRELDGLRSARTGAAAARAEIRRLNAELEKCRDRQSGDLAVARDRLRVPGGLTTS